MALHPRYHGQTAVELGLDGFVATLSRYDPGASLAAHRHESPYVCVVLRGPLHEEHEGGIDELGSGAVIVHPPGEHHADRFAGDGGLCLNIASDWSDGTEQRAVLRRSHAAILAVRITTELLTSQPDRSIAGALAADLWSLLPNPSKPARAPRWLARVEERIALDAASVTIGSLARDAGVHPAHLARTFRHHHGLSLGQHLRRTRLARCYELLATSKDSLSTIALDAGFADQSHMANLVRQHSGVTPRQLRLLLRS